MDKYIITLDKMNKIRDPIIQELAYRRLIYHMKRKCVYIDLVHFINDLNPIDNKMLISLFRASNQYKIS